MNEEEKYTGDPKDMISITRYLVKVLDVKLYKEALYFKDDNKYISNQTKLRRKIANYFPLSYRNDNEVISQMIKYSEYIEDTKFKVRIRNGIINQDKITNENYGFTPYYLDVEYNADAYDEHVDKFLNFISCEREDVRLVIEEIIGHCLLLYDFPHLMFFLVGVGANGKSTFVEMITNFIGDLANHIDISNFDDGTCIVSLIGKLVNISDDIDATYIEKSKNLKTIASGNTISARAIYSHSVEFRNTATLIFTANELPTFKDKSKGLFRRIVVIPFENQVSERIPNLIDLLSSENAKSYLLNLALKGIKRLYNNDLKLSESVTITKATKQYQLNSDSILAFITEKPNIIDKPFNQIYNNYINYARENNKPYVSENKFSRQLKNYGYTTKTKTINGKSAKVIIKQDNT